MPRRAGLVVLLAIVCNPAFSQTPYTFSNPVRSSAPDPWIVYRHREYYLMGTTGDNLTIWKAATLGALKTAAPNVVWTPPPDMPYAHDIWAPELHFVHGRWYIYFCADKGDNQSHRIWVLENSSSDPTSGKWIIRGKLADVSDKWAIDPSVFENHHRWYAVWSGWPADIDGVQNIYIARLKNAWTVQGPRVRLSTPDHAWEEHGPVEVDEGPEILKHKNKVFLVFSVSHCSTDEYGLGMLTASADSDLLNPESWTKSPTPVFTASEQARAYGPGHNGFFKSPDGKQDWIIYHANAEPNEGCGTHRSARAQRFTWNADGTPNFGRPVPLDTPIPEPSGALQH